MSERREKKKEMTQQKIMKAAKNCFLSYGFKRTTMAKIASESEVGVGTLYN